MTWVKLGDEFIDAPVWEELGAAALMLHLAALSFCNRTLSDGFVKKDRVTTLHPAVSRNARRLAGQLVDAGVWRVQGEGYVVAEYVDDTKRSDGRGDEQASAASIRERRKSGAQRVAAHRERKKRQEEVALAPAPNLGNALLTPPRPGQAEGHGLDSVQSMASAAAQLDLDAASCVHGTPGGLLPTSVGTPRCPDCRRLARSA